MAALNTTDLNNGKRDLDHVSDFATSPAPTVTDRFGQTKRSIAGANIAVDEMIEAVQSSAAASLAALGYEPAVVYAAGISMARALQTVEFNGVVYAPKAYALPFVTSGAFEVDRFRVVQGVMAQDLAGPEGADGVGTRQPGGTLRKMAAKVWEILSPRDYGGAVDGAADDTAAVLLLAARGRSLKTPVLVPKRAKNTAALAGTERYKTVYSEAWETDFIARYMNDAYMGLAVIIEGFGDSTYWAAATSNLSTQAPESPLARLELILRRYYSNNNITVRNSAWSGSSVRQMLLGTDGSGKTFEERIAASDAQIVYVNHCINSCQLGERADGYKSDMHLVAEIIRKYGKTPIFSTPNPMLPTIIGDRRKAEQLKAYAEAMRQVCREAGIPLVDNFAWTMKVLATGKFKVLDLLPDGCHPSDDFYTVLGQNLAIPLICPDGGFARQNEFLAGMSSQVLASAAGSTVSSNSRLGGGIITGSVGAQSIRIPFVVNEIGLDVYVAVPIWGSGAPAANIAVDRKAVAASFSFFENSRVGGRFVQDHEIRVIRNASPGLHFLELESAVGGLGIYYLRTRPTTEERAFLHGIAFNYRQRLLSNFEFYPSAANAIVLLDEIPTPRLDRDYRIEVSAVWQAGAGIVLNGLYCADNGASLPEPEAGFIVGLDANGYASVWENRGGAYVKLLTGLVVLTGQQLVFYIRASTGRFGVIDLYINSALIGTAVLTRAYWGGLMGFWKESSVGSFRVDRVDILSDAT